MQRFDISSSGYNKTSKYRKSSLHNLEFWNFSKNNNCGQTRAKFLRPLQNRVKFL